MKLFFTVIAVLILVLTVIDKVRIRFGYKTTKTIISERWLLVAILMCLLLIGISGHQYYITKESGAFSKMLIPIALLIVMIDQWRRR
jgi:hypothetical protein